MYTFDVHCLLSIVKTSTRNLLCNVPTGCVHVNINIYSMLALLAWMLSRDIFKSYLLWNLPTWTWYWYVSIACMFGIYKTSTEMFQYTFIMLILGWISAKHLQGTLCKLPIWNVNTPCVFTKTQHKHTFIKIPSFRLKNLQPRWRLPIHRSNHSYLPHNKRTWTSPFWSIHSSIIYPRRGGEWGRHFIIIILPVLSEMGN